MHEHTEHGHEGHICDDSCDHHIANLLINPEVFAQPLDRMLSDETITEESHTTQSIPAKDMAIYLSDPMHESNPHFEVIDDLKVSELRNPLQYHQKIGIEVGHPVFGYTWIDAKSGKKVFAVLYVADKQGRPFFIVSKKGYAADQTQALPENIYDRLLRNAQSVLGDYLLNQGRVDHSLTVDQERGAHFKLFGSNAGALIGGLRQKHEDKALTTSDVRSLVTNMKQEIAVFASDQQSVTETIHLGHNVSSNKGWQEVRRASGIVEARVRTGRSQRNDRLYVGDPLPLTEHMAYLYHLLPGVIFSGSEGSALDIHLPESTNNHFLTEQEAYSHNREILEAVVDIHTAEPQFMDNDEVKRQFAAVLSFAEQYGISFYAISARIAKAIEKGETPSELLQSVLTDRTGTFSLNT